MFDTLYHTQISRNIYGQKGNIYTKSKLRFLPIQFFFSNIPNTCSIKSHNSDVLGPGLRVEVRAWVGLQFLGVTEFAVLLTISINKR